MDPRWPITLPSQHYAAGWRAEVRPVADINALGLRYARLEDGPEKEALLLELCRPPSASGLGTTRDYTAKVKRVVEIIEHELSKQKQFTVADAGRYLEFDGDRYIRLLGRKGYLASANGGSRERFTRAPPPPAGTHQSRWRRPGKVRKACPTGPRPRQTARLNCRG